MTNVLGIIGLIVFAVLVIGAAAGVTTLVVKISPTVSSKKPKQPAEVES